MLNKTIKNDAEIVSNLNYNWQKLNNKTILISGGTGFIGSLFCDVIRYRNKYFRQNIKIISISRHKQKCDRTVKYIEHDINNPIGFKTKIDYVLHLASNTHPKAYRDDPIGTITTNIFGCNNLLKIAKQNKAHFVLASSVEIYGNCINKPVDENYCGYINCNNTRSGYNESKRLCEALIQSYRTVYGIKVNSVRFARVFGPDKKDDTKAIGQFIKYAINGENIIMKSNGKQKFSYVYVSDAVSALIKVILCGKNGEAYNVSNNDILSLREIANYIANISKTKVIMKLANKDSFASASQYAIIDNKKITKLGWKPLYNLKNGIERTYRILKTNKERL